MSVLSLRRVAIAAARRRTTGNTYYIDSATGNDANAGISPGVAWATVSHVNGFSFTAGDVILFKRGQTFTGTMLNVATNGMSSAPITVGAYSSGNPPIFDGGGTDTTNGTTTPIVVNANWVVLDGLQVQHSLKDGVQIYGTDCTVQNCVVTHNQQGLHVKLGGDRCKILSNQFLTNDIVLIGSGSNDDSGAVAMVLNADSPTVMHNYSTGHSGYSPDYGTDGSFCEIYGATNGEIAFNLSVDDKCFTELGGDSTYGHPDNNVYYDNVGISSLSTSAFLILNGTGIYGVATGTKMWNNTFYLYGSGGYGMGIESGADLLFKNNILAVPNGNMGDVLDAGGIDESNNVFWGTPSNINSSNAPGNIGIAPSSTSANPLFVNATAGADLHLQSGSPAINRGVSVSFSTDYDGNTRSVGGAPDCGAYEYDGS